MLLGSKRFSGPKVTGQMCSGLDYKGPNRNRCSAQNVANILKENVQAVFQLSIPVFIYNHIYLLYITI